MNCPRCHAFVEADAGYCSQCLNTLEPQPEPARAASALAPAVEAMPPPAVEPATFEERFPGQQACATHTGFPIAGTCSRCGKFLCVRCAPELAQTAGVRCADCATRDEKPLAGIGGCLILVDIGVVGSPLGLLVRAGSVFLVLSRSETLSGAQVAIGVLYGVALLLALYQGFVAVQFFQKKRLLPRLITLSYGVYPVFCFARVLVESGATDTMEGSNVRALVQAVIGALIWIPYFHQSKRVKATFVN